jgi:hypothetical protein
VKDTKVKNEETLTKIRTKKTARVDEVKAIERTRTGCRINIEKQLNRKTGSELASTLPPHFTTRFKNPVLVYISIIFTIFIFKNFNAVASDLFDHHFQTITVGDLSDCKMLCLARQTTPVPAKTVVNAFADPDSIRLFKIPADRHQNLHRNPFVPDQPLSSQARKSENDLYHDSFIFNYLDFSR